MRSRALAIVVVLAAVAWLPATAQAALACQGMTVTIAGTPGPDLLEGTPGHDVIHGMGGSDVILGLSGNDVICGGSGDDQIYGGTGYDILLGQGGSDTLDGGADRDRLLGSNGNDTLLGQGGNDYLVGGPGNDRLIGSSGNDAMFGGDGDDDLAGRGGADSLAGQGGNDRLNGGPGNDALDGAAGSDRCVGADGTDSAASCETVIATEIGQTPQTVTIPRSGTVALTFDDGPHPTHTPTLLDILDVYGVKATFFVVGQSVERYPEIVADIARRGHTVMNHTYSHAWLTRYSDAGIERELADGAAAIAEVTGVAPSCWRPPFGAINNRVREIAEGLGLRPILWDVDPFDWRIPGSSYVSWHILRYTSDGDVVLLHDTSGPSTYNALPDIITGLRDRGLEFVTLCG